MNLLRRIREFRNHPPYPDAPYIEDRHGEKYWIEWNSIDNMNVTLPKRHVGRLNLDFRDDGSVIIADIIIFPPYSFWERNLRKRGLGKAMLEEAIQYAREKGTKLIWGWLSPDEYTSIEYLTEWYMRQGFEVLPNNTIQKFL